MKGSSSGKPRWRVQLSRVRPLRFAFVVEAKDKASLQRIFEVTSYEDQTENDFAIVFIGSKSLSLSSGSSMKPYFR
jgi:hypothetical protein